jgi:hypothetical protein
MFRVEICIRDSHFPSLQNTQDRKFQCIQVRRKWRPELHPGWQRSLLSRRRWFVFGVGALVQVHVGRDLAPLSRGGGGGLPDIVAAAGSTISENLSLNVRMCVDVDVGKAYGSDSSRHAYGPPLPPLVRTQDPARQATPGTRHPDNAETG